MFLFKEAEEEAEEEEEEEEMRNLYHKSVTPLRSPSVHLDRLLVLRPHHHRCHRRPLWRRHRRRRRPLAPLSSFSLRLR